MVHAVDATATADSHPTVSVIINNYNYARFLPQAIDSVLRQTYDRIELIVVDDGSTDESLDVLSDYADKAKVLRKDNGGQASALNAGYACATGQIVLFLDADDLLESTIVERVVERFQSSPQVARVHFPLAIVDAEGHPTNDLVPPHPTRLPRGDLRREIVTFPDDLAFTPMSGNAFSVPVLRQVMPVPEHVYGAILADLYLLAVTPVFGIIEALDQVGGYYRVHGRNNFYGRELNLERVRQLLIRTHANHQYILTFGRQQGWSRIPTVQDDLLSVTYIANRLISWRFDRDQHPFRDDSRIKLMGLGMRSAFRRFDRPPLARTAYVLWFLIVGMAPSSAAHRLASAGFRSREQSGGAGIGAMMIGWMKNRTSRANDRTIGITE